jgi:hypothetical protein
MRVVRKRILRLVTGTLIGPALLLGASAAASPLTTQITDNGTADNAPAISGSNVVWYARDGSVDDDFEIYFARGAPPVVIPVPSVSFGGLSLLAGLVLCVVAWAGRGRVGAGTRR